jgi:hypothetical protein
MLWVCAFEDSWSPWCESMPGCDIHTFERGYVTRGRRQLCADITGCSLLVIQAVSEPMWPDWAKTCLAA